MSPTATRPLDEGIDEWGRDGVEPRDQVDEGVDDLLLLRGIVDREPDYGRREQQQRGQGEERPVRERARVGREFVALVAGRDRPDGVDDESTEPREPSVDPVEDTEDPRRGRLLIRAFPGRVLAHG